MADSADGSRALLAAEPAAVQRLLQLVGADDCPADTAAALGEAIGSLATHAVAAFEEDGAAAEAAAGLGRLLHRRRGPALRAHAARALWRLARNAPSAQAAICAAGCLPLLAALKGSCTEAEQLALGCLRELAANPDNAPAFWCVGGLRVLSSGWGCISGAAAEAALNPAALEWATRMRGSSMEWPENEECNSVVLSVDAAAALAEALAVNVTLLDLRIGDIAEGADDLCAELLADALKINSSLEDLYLNNNQISDVGAAALGEGLKINSSLTTLSLMNNHIGSVGAAALCKGLECNSNLSYLDLNDNHISDVGAAALGEVLKRNSTLTTLCLSCNLIGDVGVTALADGLESNSTLETLFLLDNQISDVGITALGKGLRSNSTLKNLILRDNPFSSAAVTTLRKWLESNTTLHLDYSDLISASQRKTAPNPCAFKPAPKKPWNWSEEEWDAATNGGAVVFQDHNGHFFRWEEYFDYLCGSEGMIRLGITA